MAEDLFITNFISELLPLASSAGNDIDFLRHFTDLMGRKFGIAKVELVTISSERKNGQFEEYMLNTRKPYIDNQLSEYSAFPELVTYRNGGYKSFAAMPLVANGRVNHLLLLLSDQENKFTESMVSTIGAVTTFFSFSFAYKNEAVKNSRLAEYFDAAFNSTAPQLLVSSDGSIVKANKEAVRAFDILGTRVKNVREIFGAGIEEIRTAAQGKGYEVLINGGNTYNTYRVTANKVGNSLLHLSAANTTGKYIMDSVLDSVAGSSLLYVIFAKEDFTILNASHNFDRDTGYTQGPFSNMRFTDLLSGTDVKRFVEFAKSGTAGPIDIEVSATDAKRHVKALVRKVLFGYLIMLANADADAYVKSARANLQGLIEGASDMVITLNDSGYITDCNMPVESTLGYNREDLIGKELSSIYKDPAVLRRDLEYARTGETVNGSYVNFLKSNSEEVPGVQSVRKLVGTEGKASYIVFAKELETKHRIETLESKLREKERVIVASESANKQKSEFIYDITHELKTPLTNIKGFATLLLDGEVGKLADEQREYVDTIVEESNRLSLIIQQVLDASKLDANKVKLDIKEVDLRALGEHPSIKALAEAARRKGLEFKWDVSYETPVIKAEQNKLIQVFVNLIGNSTKFTESGGITVHIFKKSAKTVECDVIDTGIGMSEEDRKKVFKKFYQAPKKALVHQDGAGTGLGLTITKSIIGLHGGKISVESTPGKGSRFYFTLPINKKPERKKPG